jgi:hypothetical protein
MHEDRRAMHVRFDVRRRGRGYGVLPLADGEALQSVVRTRMRRRWRHTPLLILVPVLRGWKGGRRDATS